MDAAGPLPKRVVAWELGLGHANQQAIEEVSPAAERLPQGGFLDLVQVLVGHPSQRILKPMSEPQHMDPDDFSGRYDVSMSEGDAPSELRLIVASADERMAITATREQFKNLARFIQEQLGDAVS